MTESREHVEPTSPPPHLVRMDALGRDAMLEYFARAESFRAGSGAGPKHSGRIVATLFYEPSTRTRLSFESAALRLGAQTLGFSDPAASSAAKGETLIDTIRTVERYADLIVLRHPAEGAARLAAQVASVPIVNAGDGGHEHPTQTLFDLYTIHRQRGSLDGLTLGLTGDLKYGRTVHSLALAAAAFGVTLIFIAPAPLQVPDHLRGRLEEMTVVRTAAALDEVIGELDALYVTRVQTERMDPAEAAALGPPRSLGPEDLRKAKDDLLVLHPLPRVTEIDPAVDEDPRAWYFEQLADGVVMRMAILDGLLSGAAPLPPGAGAKRPAPEDPPWRESPEAKGSSCANPKCVTHRERGVMMRTNARGGARWCAYCDWRVE